MVTAPWSVDPRTARDVAREFLGAPTVAVGAPVRVAYERLGIEAGRWFARLTSDVTATAVRVAFTSNPEPYANADELSASVCGEGVLELYSVAFDRNRRHPALDCCMGGEFDRFRAVHDLVSHGWCRLSFDRDGEFSAWLAEEAMYSRLARRALATELHAQHSVLWTSGQVADLKATVLPTELVDVARRARRAEPTGTTR